jgi:hypothetical protein
VQYGLFEIDPGCSPTSCSISYLTDLNVARETSSLAYSEASQRLYLLGALGDVTFYDSIEPMTQSKPPSLSLDSYSNGALTAIPVPEPGSTLLLATGIAFLVTAGRKKIMIPR